MLYFIYINYKKLLADLSKLEKSVNFYFRTIEDKVLIFTMKNEAQVNYSN